MIVPTSEELRNTLLEQFKATTWYTHMRLFLNSSSFTKIVDTLLADYNLGYRITPQLKYLFRSFQETAFESVKVVVFTEELSPYVLHADGVAYSNSLLGRTDNTLKDIYTELQATVDPKYKGMPDLTPWSRQGVLLITSALTTTIGNKDSHLDLWRPWNNTLFDVFKHDLPDVIYVLIGESVWEYEKKLNKNSVIMKFDTPSKKFPKPWGSNMFNLANSHLEAKNKSLINW